MYDVWVKYFSVCLLVVFCGVFGFFVFCLLCVCLYFTCAKNTGCIKYNLCIEQEKNPLNCFILAYPMKYPKAQPSLGKHGVCALITALSCLGRSLI